jgi:hypothetical protein
MRVFNKIGAMGLGVVGLLLVSLALSAEAAPPPGPHGAPEPAMLGVHWARGNAPPFGGGSSADPHLLYHGGPVMETGTEVRAIFWGTTWTPADAKINALGSFYSNVGASSYMSTNQANKGGPTVSTTVKYDGFLNDFTSAAPRRAPKTSEILAEVQKMVSAGKIVPATNGYYPVYVDTKRGGAGYCAWHSWGTVITPANVAVDIQFGFFFNLDGDSGCDPQDTSRPQGIAALANVTGHELSEVATDPRGNAWFDRQGSENADKCAWTFSGLINLGGGGSWKVQSNFANAAYDLPTGTPRGCINGN